MIFQTLSKLLGETRAPTAKLWSAVTCHRFCRLGDLSPKPGRVQRPDV